MKNMPILSWESKQLANIILYHEFKQTERGLPRRPKNNQFNIRWNFARLLKEYYNIRKFEISRVENRLDIILFRSNWFIRKEEVITAIKRGFIKLNNNIVYNHTIFLKPGDIINFDCPAALNNIEKREVEGLPNGCPAPSPSLSRPPISSTIVDWKNKSPNIMIQNVNYLEINNNVKSFALLKTPKFNNIPYPFNLHRFQPLGCVPGGH